MRELPSQQLDVGCRKRQRDRVNKMSVFINWTHAGERIAAPCLKLIQVEAEAGGDSDIIQAGWRIYSSLKWFNQIKRSPSTSWDSAAIAVGID